MTRLNEDLLEHVRGVAPNLSGVVESLLAEYLINIRRARSRHQWLPASSSGSLCRSPPGQERSARAYPPASARDKATPDCNSRADQCKCLPSTEVDKALETEGCARSGNLPDRARAKPVRLDADSRSAWEEAEHSRDDEQKSHRNSDPAGCRFPKPPKSSGSQVEQQFLQLLDCRSSPSLSRSGIAHSET